MQHAGHVCELLRDARRRIGRIEPDERDLLMTVAIAQLRAGLFCKALQPKLKKAGKADALPAFSGQSTAGCRDYSE